MSSSSDDARSIAPIGKRSKRSTASTSSRNRPSSRSNSWLTCILLNENRLGVGPTHVREHLEAHNIEARPVWKPMHLQPVYQSCRVIGGNVATALFEQGLCLPSGSSLSADAQQHVVSTLLDIPGLE